MNLKKINSLVSKAKKKYSTKSENFDEFLENKYRIFFDIEENILRDDINTEIFNEFEFFNSLVETFSEKIISNINLKAKKIIHPYTYFYSDNIIEYSFEIYVGEKASKFRIYLEEDLLISEAISKWIVLNPTSQERDRIRKLKKKLNVNVQIISNPIHINKKQQVLKNIDFNIKII